MTASSVMVAVLMSLVPLLIALVVAAVGSFWGFKLFSRLTKGIDEAAELKKGNIAVGIILLSVMVALGIVLQAGLSGISSGIDYALRVGLVTPMDIIAICIALIQFVLGALLAILAVFFSFYVFNRLTPDVNEFAEIAGGNVAMALLMAGIAILTALVIQAGVSGITHALFA
jgi:uncharacterized membrane protein YjfL (UPF0719 family)